MYQCTWARHRMMLKGEGSLCSYLTGRSESQRMMGTCCKLDHLLTWQSLDTQRLKSGHTHTLQPDYVMYFNYCRHFRLVGIIAICSLVLQSDLASWSPWPSCPSEPRPQLQTSVSRDGSPSSSSSCAAAWVWPPEDFKYVLARCRRGDPGKKKKKHPHKNTGDCCSTNRTII